MSTLSELLSRANRDPRLSTRKIAERAAARGYPIDYSTVSLYLNGKHGDPDEPTLAALAAALPVGLDELRSAAGLSHERTDPYLPPDEAARMTTRQRNAVDEIIRLLARAEGECHGRESAATNEPGEAVTFDSPGHAGPQTEASPERQDGRRHTDPH